MMSSIHIAKVDIPKASDNELKRMIMLSDVLRKERDPDEPKPDENLIMRYMRDTHPHFYQEDWLAFDGEKVIGRGNLGYANEGTPPYEENKHIAQASVSVHPDYRRQGIGRRLLSKILSSIVQNPEITTVFSGSQLDTGIAFCESMGGIFSQEGAENRLRLEEVDWNMIDQWVEEGRKLSEMEKVSLEFFEDCPDDLIDRYVEVYQETMNQQPLGEYDGKMKETPETRRLSEERNKEKGMKWFTMATVEENGDVSGLTELLFHPELPHKAFQNLTGVRDKYRGRGLGKWLKAEMLKWFTAQNSSIKYIVTGNDTTNAPMLSINERMGFRKFQTSKSYKFDLKDLLSKQLLLVQ